MSRIYRTLGTVAMTPKGEYDSSAYYEKLNIVEYEGSSYVAKQNVNNILPTNETYWLYLGGGVKITDTLYVFDTVAAMKASTKLKNGFTAQTLGYYSINDGGGSTYKIRTKTNDDVIDEMFIIGLADNTLIAELIINNNTIRFRQVGDNWNCLSNTNVEKIIFEKDTYDVSSSITISRKLELDFNGSTVNYTGNNTLFNISTHFNYKCTIKNGTFTGSTSNTFITANDNTWGVSFDIINCTINKFAYVFNCYQNFNNLFEEININSNGLIQFVGNNISNAIKFDKCYIKTYDSLTDVYPDYRIILTNVRNLEFNGCSFEQCKTLFNNTSCNYITLSSCEFEAMNYIAKNSTGFNNLVGNVMMVGNVKLFETDTIANTPLTILSSSRYFSHQSSDTALRSILRNSSNLKEIYSTVYTEGNTDSIKLYSITDASVNLYIPFNVLRNESSSASNYLLTSVAPILGNQENESFIFTIYNYIIGNDDDYQVWKSEWIEINKTTFLNLSREKVVDGTSSGSSLENNVVTESFTVRNYQVNTSVNYKKVYTIIRFNGLGNQIFAAST